MPFTLAAAAASAHANNGQWPLTCRSWQSRLVALQVGSAVAHLWRAQSYGSAHARWARKGAKVVSQRARWASPSWPGGSGRLGVVASGSHSGNYRNDEGQVELAECKAGPTTTTATTATTTTATTATSLRLRVSQSVGSARSFSAASGTQTIPNLPVSHWQRLGRANEDYLLPAAARLISCYPPSLPVVHSACAAFPCTPTGDHRGDSRTARQVQDK